MDSSTGKEQTQAIWKVIVDWNLENKVQILCCDTTASNTDKFNGACMLLEQKFHGEMLFFACHNCVYELVLRTVFKAKIKQVTIRPNIQFFKKLKGNWKNIDPTIIQCYRETVKLFQTKLELENLLEFYRVELKTNIFREDYRELIEFFLIFRWRC